MKNGVLNIKSQNELSSLNIVFRGSTNNESYGIYGISHLMEHILCDGYKHLEKDFERYGLNVNAYTSDSEIVFHISGLDEYVYKFSEEYIKAITEQSIKEDKFLNEQKIVLQEYNNHFNNQIYAHQSNLYRKLYDNYGPIGERGNLEDIQFENIIAYQKKQFEKPSQIIYVSKDHILPVNCVGFDNREYKDCFNLKTGEHKMIVENVADFKDQTSVIYASPIVKDEFAAVKVVCAMLGSGLISPLYDEIREKRGLVYFIWCYIDKIDDNSGVINIASEMENKNIVKFSDVLTTILENKEKYLTQERLDIVREYFNILIKKKEILRYNDVRKFIDPIEWNTETVINSMTLGDVYRVFDKYFALTRWHRSIDKLEFLSEEPVSVS